MLGLRHCPEPESTLETLPRRAASSFQNFTLTRDLFTFKLKYFFFLQYNAFNIIKKEHLLYWELLTLVGFTRVPTPVKLF